MPPDPILPQRIGRYEIVERLGEGGMGVLYLARDPRLHRHLAIKVLAVYNRELRERFAREARSAASLQHQNIVIVYDVGEEQGRPFIAMEYIDGETLSEVIRGRPEVGIRRKLQWMIELGAGLGYAHRMGIIHRDIKPANLMITSDGVLKILDFGLARLVADATNAGLTTAGVMLGTPHYMSPEQIEGTAVDHRSDIFSVGLVLYELLTHRKAYPGDSPQTVLHRILTTEPPPIRESYGDVDPLLEQAVRRAIEKSPDRRYQDLAKLTADLTRVLDRVREHADDRTVPVDRARADEVPPATPLSPRAQSRPESGGLTPRQIPNLDSIERRRAAQLDEHVERAVEQLKEGRVEQAIEHCESALVIEPRETRALELLQEAHRVLEERQVADAVARARVLLSNGELSAAESILSDAERVRPDSPSVFSLRTEIEDRRRARERARERARGLRAALDRGRADLAAGALEAAVRAAKEALVFDAASAEAEALRQDGLAAIEQRQQRQDENRRAREAIAAARQAAAEGHFDAALRGLATFDPARSDIVAVESEIRRALVENERRQAESEERARRQRADEEQRRLAEGQRRREDEEQRRLAEEQHRREDEEQRRLAEEQRSREDEEQRRLVEEQYRREDEQQRRLAEEQHRREDEQQRRLAEEQHRREDEERRRFAEEQRRRDEELRDQAARAARDAEGRPAAAAAEARRREAATEYELDAGPPTLTADLNVTLTHVETARPAAGRPVASARLWAWAGAGLLLLLVSLTYFARLAQSPESQSRTTETSTSAPTTGVGTVSPDLSPTVDGKNPAPSLALFAVTVEAVPWAEIRISPAPGTDASNTAQGVTPFTASLPEGEYSIQFTNSMFPSPAAQRFVVRAGAANQVRFVFPGFDADKVVDDLLPR